MTIQQLHSKEVHLRILLTPHVFPVLWLPMCKEDKAIGLRGAEVKGDGAHALSVPLGKADKGFWTLKADGVQSSHVLTFEDHISVDLHFCVSNSGQA